MSDLLIPKTKTKKRTNPVSKYRQSAKGESCTLQLENICNHNCETTVLCHVSPPHYGKMGGKESNLHSVYGCSDCHDAIDGRTNHNLTDGQLAIELFRAMYLTQLMALKKGLIEVES